MTEEHRKTATGVSFCELKYLIPTLEDYIKALPYLTFKNYKLEATDNCWAYIPTLYKLEGKWGIDWIDAVESNSIKIVKGTTPLEAAKNAYNWCVKEGYIKDILNNKQIMLIKTVPDPTLMCEGCVFDGKFECLKMACCADENNPVKYIEVEE